MNISFMAIRTENGLELLDQTKLPNQTEWIKIESIDEICEAIVMLRVRGAPLIAVAATAFMIQSFERDINVDTALEYVERLSKTRPTAVNLFHCLKIIETTLKTGGINSAKIAATAYLQKEIDIHQKLTKIGAHQLQNGSRVLTHCNTGSLATVCDGTALGVIKVAHQQGKKLKVYVDETRPLLQGARLTCYELEKAGIEYELICDSMAAWLMKQKKVDSVWVGADRIANNGDAANKIGSYGLAVQAKHHGVPYYVVAPSTTFDLECESGVNIEIEQRDSNEVRGYVGASLVWAPKEAGVYNPAFDVIDANLYTAIVCEQGLVETNKLTSLGLKALNI